MRLFAAAAVLCLSTARTPCNCLALSGQGRFYSPAAPAALSGAKGARGVELENRWNVASFDEEGYLWLAGLGSTEQTMRYIERLADRLGLKVTDPLRLQGFAPHFSGERAIQTFFALKRELIQVAASDDAWLAAKSPAVEPLSLVATSDAGSSAPLTPEGYQAVVALRDNEAMKRFIVRTVEDLGFRVCNEGGLNGIAPFYSGVLSSQSFAKLRSEIMLSVKAPEPWVASGSTAPLNERGFSLVSSMRIDLELRAFIKRLVKHFGCKVRSDVALSHVVQRYFSMPLPFSELEEEVRSGCGLHARGHQYGSIHEVVGKAGVLQISMPRSERAELSRRELEQAGVVPTFFEATNAHTEAPEVLDGTCPISTNLGTYPACQRRAQELKIDYVFGDAPGCKSKVEQGIADSHRRALLAAMARNDSEWTAIIEDDVVPLHTGVFDKAFAKTWKLVPAWAKMVRLGWCTFESDLGSISKTSLADGGRFRLVSAMEWRDSKDEKHYYTGGCTTGYMVHKSLIPELLGIFPCCCPIDCCLERQLFYAPPKAEDPRPGRFRGEQIMINMDSWDSFEDSNNYTSFNQGGVFVQDNREKQQRTSRPEWNKGD